MKSRLSLLLPLGFIAAVTVSAQTFVGTSDFSAATNWTNYDGTGNGALAINSNQLEYSVGTGTTSDQRIYSWGGYAPSSDWSVKVDVHLAAMGLSNNGQFANLNLVIVYGDPANNNMFDVAID